VGLWHSTIFKCKFCLDTTLSFYGESVGLLQNYPEGLSLISRLRLIEVTEKRSMDEFGRIKKIKSKALIASKFDINIKNLPTGKYLINWDLIDSTNKVIARSQKEIQKSNPSLKSEYVQDPLAINGSLEEQIANLSIKDARYYVASLLPISTNSDQTSIDYLRKKGTETEVRNYLQSFWTKKNKENPLVGFVNYKELLAEAEKKYATQTMLAYQTDRGRVFLQYGKPNMVENEYSDRFRQAMKNLNTVPYEIWYYYTLEKPVKQNDIIFVFIQENRGNDNYRLYHSTGLGEVRNREWRKSVETNATYNYDRMDPNDRNDNNDTKKFR